MDLSDQKTFFQMLGDKLDGLGLQTAPAAGSGQPQVGDTLRILVPVTEDGDVVLMELMVASLNEETDLLQFYTTLIMELGPGYEALSKALMQWNFLCPLGSFGIFEQEKQLYHKYGIPVSPKGDAGELAEQTLSILALLYDVISKQFPAAVRLSEGGQM